MCRDVILLGGLVEKSQCLNATIHPHGTYLNEDGNSVQWTADLAGSSFVVQGFGDLLQDIQGRGLGHGVEVAVMLLDLGETCIDKAGAGDGTSIQHLLESFGVGRE